MASRVNPIVTFSVDAGDAGRVRGKTDLHAGVKAIFSFVPNATERVRILDTMRHLHAAACSKEQDARAARAGAKP